MITENLSTLKIHKLTQAQYERERDAGRIDENALYLTPDEENAGNQIYTQNEEPVDAPDGALWLDMDEESSGINVPVKGVDYWTEADKTEIVEQAAALVSSGGGVTVDAQAIINEVLAQVLENEKKKYHVGYLWISTSSTNPKDILGFGTWEQVKDTFLLAAGNTYAAGSTGGEATHTLTIDEMPSHDHGAKGWAAVVDGSGKYITLGGNGNSDQYFTRTRGGGQPHNNMPPYLAVYVWQRIA